MDTTTPTNKPRHRRSSNRRILRGLIVAVLLGTPSAAYGVDSAKTITRAPLKNPQTFAVRIQLKGWGFIDTAGGFRPEMTGNVGTLGPVAVRLEEESALVIVGIEDGKVRARGKGRWTFTGSDGILYGAGSAELFVPIILTTAGPIPDPSRWSEAVESIEIVGGTGRYANATGTISLRGVFAEIPGEGGRRRSATEFSGEGAITIERAVNA